MRLDTTVVVLCILPALLASGCGVRYEDVDGATVEREWLAAADNSADSWWYVGTVDGHHYIVRERTAVDTRGYRVATSAVVLRVEVSPTLRSRADWHNLKSGEIEFTRE